MFGNHLGLPEFFFFILIIFPLTACLIIYLIPTAIAVIKHRANTAAIVLINILAGWTLVGWVVALVLSLNTPHESTAVPNSTG